MTFDHSEIHDIIVNGILSSMLHIPEEALKRENWDMPLTGAAFRLQATDLIHLLFTIEKVFGIRIEEGQLAAYGFNTINKIAVAVEEAVRRKQQHLLPITL